MKSNLETLINAASIGLMCSNCPVDDCPIGNSSRVLINPVECENYLRKYVGLPVIEQENTYVKGDN